MKKSSDIAAEYFQSGFNCAQAVFLTFCEHYGIDKETALKLSSSFGGGMGRLREVCGAVSSMFAIAGLECGYTNPSDDISKANHYKLIQSLAKKFENEHGSIICRELLKLQAKEKSPIPSKRTETYYKERPCIAFVKTAAELIEQELLNQRSKNLPK